MSNEVNYRTAQNVNLLNDDLKRFDVVFSDDRLKHEKDGTRLVLTLVDGQFQVVAGEESKYWRRSTAPAKGGRSQAEENNAIRSALLKALRGQFGVNSLPPCVKEALKGSNIFVGSSDMEEDEKSPGTVTTGRPLTMRRVKQIITAACKAASEEQARIQGLIKNPSNWDMKELGKLWEEDPSVSRNFGYLTNEFLKTGADNLRKKIEEYHDNEDSYEKCGILKTMQQDELGKACEEMFRKMHVFAGDEGCPNLTYEAAAYFVYKLETGVLKDYFENLQSKNGDVKNQAAVAVMNAIKSVYSWCRPDAPETEDRDQVYIRQDVRCVATILFKRLLQAYDTSINTDQNIEQDSVLAWKIQTNRELIPETIPDNNPSQDDELKVDNIKYDEKRECECAKRRIELHPFNTVAEVDKDPIGVINEIIVELRNLGGDFKLTKRSAAALVKELREKEGSCFNKLFGKLEKSAKSGDVMLPQWTRALKQINVDGDKGGMWNGVIQFGANKEKADVEKFIGALLAEAKTCLNVKEDFLHVGNGSKYLTQEEKALEEQEQESYRKAQSEYEKRVDDGDLNASLNYDLIDEIGVENQIDDDQRKDEVIKESVDKNEIIEDRDPVEQPESVEQPEVVEETEEAKQARLANELKTCLLNDTVIQSFVSEDWIAKLGLDAKSMSELSKQILTEVLKEKGEDVRTQAIENYVKSMDPETLERYLKPGCLRTECKDALKESVKKAVEDLEKSVRNVEWAWTERHELTEFEFSFNCLVKNNDTPKAVSDLLAKLVCRHRVGQNFDKKLAEHAKMGDAWFAENPLVRTFYPEFEKEFQILRDTGLKTSKQSVLEDWDAKTAQQRNHAGTDFQDKLEEEIKKLEAELHKAFNEKMVAAQKLENAYRDVLTDGTKNLRDTLQLEVAKIINDGGLLDGEESAALMGVLDLRNGVWLTDPERKETLEIALKSTIDGKPNEEKCGSVRELVKKDFENVLNGIYQQGRRELMASNFMNELAEVQKGMTLPKSEWKIKGLENLSLLRTAKFNQIAYYKNLYEKVSTAVYKYACEEFQKIPVTPQQMKDPGMRQALKKRFCFDLLQPALFRSEQAFRAFDERLVTIEREVAEEERKNSGSKETAALSLKQAEREGLYSLVEKYCTQAAGNPNFVAPASPAVGKVSK